MRKIDALEKKLTEIESKESLAKIRTLPDENYNRSLALLDEVLREIAQTEKELDR